MKLSEIVFRLRTASTRFGNNIGGAADMALVQENTLKGDVAFVIPVAEQAGDSRAIGDVDQTITEIFGVVVALRNDLRQSDAAGLIAFDSVEDIRAELFKAILGWELDNADSLISYYGGQIIQITRAYLWYRFDFKTTRRILQRDDGFTELIVNGEEYKIGDLVEFKKLYSEWLLREENRTQLVSSLPRGGADMETVERKIADGAFSNKEFSQDFELYNNI